MKEKVRKTALLLGADDLCFVSCAPTDAAPLPHGLAGDPASLLPGAKSVLLLFFGYRATSLPPPPLMGVSGYYPRSHQGYRAAKDLCKYMDSLGLPNVHANNLHNRPLCLRSGGYRGDNSLYFHERLGSLIAVQTIVTTLPPDPPGQSASGCSHCGRCEAACPTGAISGGKTDYSRCLRYHMTGVVPEDMRGKVYQLFGCEKCQTCCPGQQPVAPTVAFDVSELLSGVHTSRLKALVGPNTARATLISSQAALYAGANRVASALPALERLANSDNERAAVHARWAVERITAK